MICKIKPTAASIQDALGLNIEVLHLSTPVKEMNLG